MQKVSGAADWRGSEIANSRRWIRDLTPAHVGELEAALAAVERRSLPWSEVTAADFALPGMAALLADIAEELENGSGMVKLRGVPVGRHDETALRRLYFG